MAPADASSTASSSTSGGSSGSSPRDKEDRSSRTRDGGDATNSVLDRPGVKKDIKLDGFSAYTKESTADWAVRPSEDYLDELDDFDDGDTGSSHSQNGGRRTLRPVPPITALTDAAASNPATRSATPESTSIDTAVDTKDGTATTSHDGASGTPDGYEHRNAPKSTSGCNTAPIFILRPLKARGSLVIHESSSSGASDPVRPSAALGSVAEEAGAAAAAAAGAGGEGGLDVGDSRDNNDVEPPPLAAVSLEVGPVLLQVDTRQYAVLNEGVSALAMSQRRFRFRTVRPTTAVLDDPAAWWRYAIR